VRLVRFYGLFPFLGLLLLGPLAMLVARLRGPRDGPDWRFAARALGFSALACLAWVLLMFGPPDATTVIHQGTLALPLLAAAACVAAACAVDLRFGTALVVANIALVLLVYVPALSPPPGSSYSWAAALATALSLLGIGYLALRPPSA
jgi:peptidoglycan/LPS O-acetylase OafA/YrhL